MRNFRIALMVLALVVSGCGNGDAQITQTGAGVVAGGGVAPAVPCSGTGLLFNVACNSQYIGTL